MPAVDPDCPFCKIVAGTIPSEKVSSTAHTYAFRDLNPTAPTHVLVVPRDHITNASTVAPGQEAIVGELVQAARAVAEQERILDTGYRLVFNVGGDALNSVPHLHLHVIGGRRMTWPPG